jgi:hypothetical protein
VIKVLNLRLVTSRRIHSTEIEYGGFSVFSVESLLRLRGFRLLRAIERQGREKKTLALKDH